MAEALADLRGLRTAPHLDASQREQLRSELLLRMQACDWFTVGVMAPTARQAVQVLRSLESELGWQPLEPDPAGESLEMVEGPVFLKANQHTGRFLLRREQGLGEGLLITGHNPAEPAVEDTWGPLPLDCFG
ncbi:MULTISPECIES: DUF1824 family protein [Aphanothece]|uniref:DUF1824 family protein n=1 Tax=Aphanothece TaxID=1121 RepID=UPI003984DC5E